MSRKDFTDWNGPKRKALLRPQLEHVLPYRRAGNKKDVGIKIKVDRYKAALKQLKTVMRWRVEAREKRGEWLRHFYRGSIKRAIRDLRRIKDQYKKEGCLERVLSQL